MRWFTFLFIASTAFFLTGDHISWAVGDAHGPSPIVRGASPTFKPIEIVTPGESPDGCSTQPVSYSGPAIDIPDNMPAGVSIPIVVSNRPNPITDIDFRFDGTAASDDPSSNTVGVNHSFVGDLRFTLTSPAGTSVTFFDRPGVPATTFGCATNNLFNLTLSDDGGYPSIETNCPQTGPITGTFSPNTLLSAFDGQNPNGVWILNVSDNKSGDTGTLRAFSLIISGFCPGDYLTIAQAASPEPVAAGHELTYTLVGRLIRIHSLQPLCPVVRFDFPIGVPISFVSAQGTNNYVAQPDAQGVTFSGGCLHPLTVPPYFGTATFNVVVVPQQAGILTSPGNHVVIDPDDLIPTDNDGDNTAATITTTVIAPPSTLFDFDGDLRSDISVYRPTDGNWYISRSSGGFSAAHFGSPADRITPADYDGDGKTDIAVYRPETGIWYITNSSDGTVTYHAFGLDEDLPTPADYDGDGRADISVFRPSSGIWYRLDSSTGQFVAIQFGAVGDKPTIGDFDGDGRSDVGVFRQSTGAWYQLHSSDGTFFGEQFGVSTDKIAPADYDGDSKTDIAIFRPAEGLWYLKNSATGTYTPLVFGLAQDIPVPGDYDGDSRADIAVFRPSDGTWYITNSSRSYTISQFGTGGDIPTQSAFAAQ